MRVNGPISALRHFMRITQDPFKAYFAILDQKNPEDWNIELTLMNAKHLTLC